MSLVAVQHFLGDSCQREGVDSCQREGVDSCQREGVEREIRNIRPCRKVVVVFMIAMHLVWSSFRPMHFQCQIQRPRTRHVGVKRLSTLHSDRFEEQQ